MQAQLPLYLAIGGAVIMLVAVLIYLFAGPRAKVAATVIGVIAGVVLGTGLGMILMFQAGWSLERPDRTARSGKAAPRPTMGAPPAKGPALKTRETTKEPPGENAKPDDAVKKPSPSDRKPEAR